MKSAAKSRKGKLLPFMPDTFNVENNAMPPEEKLWLAVIKLTIDDLNFAIDCLLTIKDRNACQGSGHREIVNYNQFVFDIRRILHEIKSPWFAVVCGFVDLSPDRVSQKASECMQRIPFDIESNEILFRGHGKQPKRGKLFG
jgi:hypothetical protein